MTQSTSTAAPAGRRSRPTLGLVAQIAGVIGAIVCVIAIIAVFTGRTWVQQRVEVLSNGADKAITQALEVSTTALDGLAAGFRAGDGDPHRRGRPGRQPGRR